MRILSQLLVLETVLLLICIQENESSAFVPTAKTRVSKSGCSSTTFLPLARPSYSASKLFSTNEEDAASDEEGVSLAADFFKAMKNRNIEFDADDLITDDEDEDEDDEDEDDEEEEINFPQGAINAFTGYDAGGVGNLAGNVTLTNDQVYSELKERVLESAGAFIDLVGNKGDEDDDDESSEVENKPKVYVTPEKVPDSELTAGDVVTTVLDALLHNDVPRPNRGIEVLFGYSSPGSAISQAIKVEGMTPGEYADFLKEENEYKVLFDHYGVVIDKGDYSFDKKKAFFTARLQNGEGPLDFISVNFILSTEGQEEEDCWLIDSLLIRPEGMRRRRRR